MTGRKNERGKRMIAVKMLGLLADKLMTQRELANAIGCHVQTVSFNMTYLAKMKLVRIYGRRDGGRTGGGLPYIWGLHPRMRGRSGS